MWKINKLTLTDFKSYKGTHIIPNFHNFQAVIGPNGAGKSNLMDAISFVLGVKVGFLRGTNLKDLIHDDETMENPPTKAIVELELKHSNGTIKTYQRSIGEVGGSEYRLNGKVVTEKEYQSDLRDINIDVKVKNFLVFQGDVIDVASMNEKQLTKMVESICGNNELAKEYDRLKEEKERAEEQTLTCFQKKKGMNAEKKQYKQMKEEAEKYQELENELLEEKKKLMLIDIQNHKKGMDKFAKENEEKKKKLDEFIEEKTEKEKEYEDAVEKVREKTKEENKKKDQLRKVKREKELLKPEEVKLLNKKKLTSDKIRIKEKEMRLLERKIDEEEAKKNELNTQIEEKQNILENITTKKTIKLTAKQQRDFEKMNEEYQKEYSKKENELNELQIQIKQNEEEIAQMGNQEELREINEKIESLEHQIERYEESIEKEKETKQENENELEETKEKLQNKKENIEKVQHELKTNEERMSELRMLIEDTKFEKEFNELIEELKRLFSKVHGRVDDLYQINSKKKRDIISLAIGKWNKALVVEDAKTAIDCLRYVKEQRKNIKLTFICLRELKTKEFNQLDDYLNDMRVSYAYQQITYDDIYDSVFRFVLNNTLIVDNLNDARTIAFNPKYKNKFRLITSVGSIVEKNALMVGGMNEERKKKSNVDMKKNEAERIKLSTKKQQLEETLKEYQQVEITDVQEIELKLNGNTQRINIMEKNKKERQKELEGIKKKKQEIEKKTNGKDIKEMKKKMNQQKQLFNELEEELETAQKTIFNQLNEELEIENVYLECNESKQKEREMKQFELQKEIDTLNELKRIEEEKPTSTEKMELDAEIQQLRDIIEKEIHQEEEKLEEQMKQKSQRIEEITNELSTIMREIEKLKTNVQNKKKEYHQIEEKIRTNQKEQAIAKSKYSKLQVALDEIVRNARLEQIELPIIENENEDRSSQLSESFKSMNILTQTTSNVDNITFNYDCIKHIRITNQEQYLRARNEYQEKINTLEMKINGLTPNMKAIDQFNGIVTQLQDINQDFEETRNVAKEAVEKFNEVKRKRRDKFMEAFEHLSKTIDPIYKELTRSNRHPLGGTAYLSLENTEEPYLGGLKYSAMPPFKRFHDLEQLSGGEKTIAALALLFAIQSYYPSPFFILDEIDAALDISNILQVANYIQKKCNDVQFLVISLKDTLYEKADALIGVARDLQKKSSVIYTLDLKDYDLE